MATVSLRLSDRDDELIRHYAKVHDVDLSTFIRQATLEKIEEEYDLALFDAIWMEEKEAERIRHADVKKELGL